VASLAVAGAAGGSAGGSAAASAGGAPSGAAGAAGGCSLLSDMRKALDSTEKKNSGKLKSWGKYPASSGDLT
jgi:hypothetical protein